MRLEQETVWGEIKINTREPSVVVVYGGAGVGKTSLAEEIAKKLGTRLLNSDEFRRKRYQNLQYQEWHSSVAMTDMLKKAKQLFIEGTHSIVMDATFAKWRSRQSTRRLANEFGKRLVWVEVICQDNKDVSKNIDGLLINRQYDETADIGPRIVIDNSVKTEAVAVQMRNFADLIVISK